MFKRRPKDDKMELLPIVWQDHEIHFNTAPSEYKLAPGERAVAVLERVEDVKGNPGELGTLTITNLRIVWVSEQHDRTNLSIGFETIHNTLIQSRQSKALQCDNKCLFLEARTTRQMQQTQQKYEFQFAYTADSFKSVTIGQPLKTGQPAATRDAWRQYLTVRLGSVLEELLAVFRSTIPFRNLVLHSALLNTYGDFELFPQEELYEKLGGVSNLYNDEGVLGTMYITNVRIAWHAMQNLGISVSLPYLQIDAVRTQKSKFGLALVVDTTPKSGGYLLGFLLDSAQRCSELAQRLRKLWKTHRAQPLLGVFYELDARWTNAHAVMRRVARSTEQRRAATRPAEDPDEAVLTPVVGLSGGRDPEGEDDTDAGQLAPWDGQALSMQDLRSSPNRARSPSLIPLAPSQENLGSISAVYSGDVTDEPLDAAGRAYRFTDSIGFYDAAPADIFYDTFTGLCAERFPGHDAPHSMRKLWRNAF